MCGFEYDSSIVPAVIPFRQYGIKGTPVHPNVVKGGLYEVPLTSLQVFNWRVPSAGGGYLRFLPLAAHRRAISALHRSGYPAVVYVQPLEFDPQLIKNVSQPMKLSTRLSSSNRTAEEHLVGVSLLYRRKGAGRLGSRNYLKAFFDEYSISFDRIYSDRRSIRGSIGPDSSSEHVHAV